MCVQAYPLDALGMTQEYEQPVYDKRNVFLNKRQLLAIGDRSFPNREKHRNFHDFVLCVSALIAAHLCV